MAIRRRPCVAPRGSGLAEVVISTALVGIMMVAALEAIGQSFRTRRMNADRLTGPGLAQDLMTEILSMPYEDPQNPGGAIGVDSGETVATRSTFDDVDDYHNWNAANGVARSGTARTGYSSWNQQVAVAWIDSATSNTSVTDTGLKRITVTITSPAGVASQMVALRSRYGPLEQSRPLADVAVSWTGVELRTGTNSRSQFAAAPAANHVKDAN